ncbi:hypothetical protein SLEP1_g58622 [Rubroshorea leprosula]|uniref:Water stress and hypersensitive response domain-containing protein n=1 Tax=Rubroshorea leprosula TaxID=152421 RepID=A0AAV5MPV7_9ROSI|nr:hypothetical protein SLEP1_g58622 [Rubroshorea leprosula]
MLPTSQLVDKAKNFVAEKVANIKKPEATLTDVNMKNFSREGVELNAKVSVNNPYGHPLPGDCVGDMPDPGSLKASDTTMLEVPVKVPYSIMVSLARDIGADWDIDYELEVGLTIDLLIIGDLKIPLSTKVEIKLPTLSDLF